MALSFDASYYLSQRPDVFNAFVATAGSTGLTWAQFAERHYNDYGRFEGANPNSTFNTNEYLMMNPDVAAAGVNPFSHYLQYGVNEGRAPSASFPSFASFNSAAYLAANTDLAGAGIDTPQEAYAHFVLYGQFEGRPGAPVVDTGIPGTTFTLTTGTDGAPAIVGTANNDIFNAGVGLSADGTTKIATTNALDTIDGGAGVDTLRIENTGGVNTLTGTYTNIENLTFLGAGKVNNDASVNVSAFSGAVRLQQTDDTAVTLTNIKGQTIVADRVASATIVTANYDAAQTSAAVKAIEAAGNLTFEVSGAALASATLSVDKTAAGTSVTINNAGNTDTLKTVNVAASGKSTVIATSDVLETVNVTGNGAVTLTAAASKAIDASASTGGVTVTNAIGANVSFVGGTGKDTVELGATTKAITTGAGDDTVILTGAVGAGGSVDAGEGKDTLSMSAANAATVSATTTFENGISNFEVLKLGSTVAAATIDLANMDDINYVQAAGTGAAGLAETATFTFGGLTAGQSFTVAGRTVTATGGNLTAAQVETAFVSGTSAGNAAVSGALSGYTAGNGAAPADGTVVFTSTTSGNVTPDLTASSAGNVPAPGAPSVVETTPGAAESAPGAGDGTTEVQTVTFGGLVAGQAVTVAGRTVTATSALSAADVEAAYLGGPVAGATVSGAVTGFTAANDAANTAGVITLTSTTPNSNVALASSSSSGTTAPTAPTPTISQGTAGGDLTLTNFTSGGTLELTGVVAAGVTANVKNAGSSTSDVFNIVLGGAANLLNTGSVTVANVETINVTATDSTVDTPALANPAAASTLKLNAADATSITVSGNHGVDFTGSTFTKVTSFDASGVVATGATAGATADQIGTAGAVTFATAVTDKAVTITGGNGADVLSAASLTDTTAKASATINGGAGNDTITGGNFNDTLSGGEGNDIITGGLGADTLSGGAGKDVFVFNAVGESTVAARDVITDFQANTFGNGAAGAAGTGAGASASWNGDVIRFDVGPAGAGVGVIAGAKVGVLGSAVDAQTFIQNTFADATPNEFAAALDSSTGTLYIDANADGNIDSVITLTGVTTLTAAAFELV